MNNNTPLMLAIKLESVDAITVLCDHDADIRHKPCEGSLSPIEYAVLTKNERILKILICASKKQKISYWENNKDFILQSLKSIPDFTINIKLNFHSNIFSLFSSLTPCDYYTVNIIINF